MQIASPGDNRRLSAVVDALRPARTCCSSMRDNLIQGDGRTAERIRLDRLSIQ